MNVERLRLDLSFCCAGHVEHPQRGVSALVRDVGNVPRIARPARTRRVERAVGELERHAAVARHEPELIVLRADVRAVHHTLAVGRPVRPRLPRRLLVVDEPHRVARLGAHAPEAARPPDLSAVRDDDQFLPVRRPRWREIVIVHAVVVARELAVAVRGDPCGLRSSAVPHIHRVDVPPPLIRLC